MSILSKHAKALGYDAVILFLDELVLWLASRAADASFVSSEGTKLVKLVEASPPAIAREPGCSRARGRHRGRR